MDMGIDIYTSLMERGVVLRLVDGQLKARAATGSLTDAVRHDIRTHKEMLIALLQQRDIPAEGVTATTATTVHSGPLTPTTPCTVCGAAVRWNDAGVWRCVTCWPTPLTKVTRQAENRYQASCGFTKSRKGGV